MLAPTAPSYTPSSTDEPIGCGSELRSPYAVLSPDIARLVEAWSSLPPHIRAAIQSLVDACVPDGVSRPAAR
ncbi:MAG: hypothetical protein ACRC1K_11360 [Planctomycetia bacterium]